MGGRLGIVTPCSWGVIPRQFYESFVQFQIPIPWSLIVPNRGRQDDQRNMAIHKLQETGGFTKILFLDIDHIFPGDTIQKLFSHNKPIVSGLSFRRTFPYDPILFRKVNDEKLETITTWDHGSLIEVDAVGAACLLVDMEVFSAINDKRWFEMNYPFGEGTVSEDIAFCLKTKKAGYNIFVDTSCVNKHLGVLEVDESVWIANGCKLKGEEE